MRNGTVVDVLDGPDRESFLRGRMFGCATACLSRDDEFPLRRTIEAIRDGRRLELNLKAYRCRLEPSSGLVGSASERFTSTFQSAKARRLAMPHQTAATT